jgi:5-methyltetrahydrofolate--homocysteine methyltransferase
LGVQTLTLSVEEVEKYIDWTPFFQTWQLAGRYPQLLTDEIIGEEARQLFADAQQMLEQIKEEKKFTLKAVCGLFEANSDGDDIELYSEKGTYHFRTLRQQTQKTQGQFNYALSDFVAPKSLGLKDYMGCFAVSAGFGVDEWVKEFEQQFDEYSSILVKALADRLAEAAAEYLHAKVRREIWGYAPSEGLSNDDLIDEKYQGIRPAPGYPACPDHQEKTTIWEVLSVEKNTGIVLTENLAMFPAASVSGYYFAHREAKYFGLGKITEEQVIDYAQRKGASIENAKRWLGPQLF